ncbi:MAG: aldo/keto reductase [Acidobacteriia bacterium]|nr:aldo/keto reductase [Terriglobia bacterium]
MSKPVGYIASARLLSIATDLCGSEVMKAEKSPPASKLIQRPLGKTGVSLPIVSMGVMNADAPGLIARSYELGIRHFDTAAGYQGGRNETMLGDMIRQLKARDKVVIATKAGVHGLGRRDAAEIKTDFLRTFEGSLKRLQMDYVDILYVHGVSTSREVDEKGVQDALAQLKKEKKVRFAGVSTHSGQTEVLNALLRGGFYEVALVAFNYTMSSNKELLDAMKLCASKGVGLIAMKTQAGGSRRRRDEASAKQPINQTAALKWVLQNEYVTTAVPGYTQFDQIDEDMTVASSLGLTEKERDFLSNNTLKASLEFCQQCGECVGTCPKRVEIPALMRTHMYAFQYANMDQARFTQAEVPKGAGIDVCRLCPECSASCANTVNIPRKVDELKTAWLV